MKYDVIGIPFGLVAGCGAAAEWFQRHQGAAGQG
jgi:hypothetical protein